MFELAPGEAARRGDDIVSETRVRMDGRGLLRVTQRAAARWMRIGGAEQSAAIAFNALLSLAPLVLLLLTAASHVLGSETARARLMEAVGTVGGPQALPPVRALVDTILRSRGGLLVSAVGVLVMLHFSSAVFLQLRSALNRIWDFEPRGGLKGALRERAVSLVYVPAAVLIGMFMMVAGLAGAVLRPGLEQVVPVSPWLGGSVQAVVLFALLALLLAFLFRHGPGARVDWGDVWIGSLLTAALFTLGNYLLGSFMGRSLVSSFYGAAGALVIVLLWIFYSAHLLLYGACFTREYAERFGSRAGPSGV